ncbi:MAG TPA: YciI family protein [Oleiagrimonas sp.]|nr:YciI family protein [Oleiagrimonas sp.]
MKRYLVTIMRNPGFDAGLVDAHRDFLDRLRERGCLEMAGPFTDGSGGACLLRAEDMQDAEAMAFEDPLHISGSSTVTVREWTAA